MLNVLAAWRRDLAYSASLVASGLAGAARATGTTLRNLLVVGTCSLMAAHWPTRDTYGQAGWQPRYEMRHVICHACWWCTDCGARRLDLRDYDEAKAAAQVVLP